MVRKPINVRLVDGKIFHYSYKKKVGKHWQTWYCITHDARFEIEFDDGSVDIFIIPAGTHTDAASVPSILRGDVLSVSAKSIHFSGIGHDGLYLFKRYGRKMCDKIFLLMMDKIDHVGWLQRYRAYWAVRLFASKHYGGRARQFADKNKG